MLNDSLEYLHKKCNFCENNEHSHCNCSLITYVPFKSIILAKHLYSKA